MRNSILPLLIAGFVTLAGCGGGGAGNGNVRPEAPTPESQTPEPPPPPPPPETETETETETPPPPPETPEDDPVVPPAPSGIRVSAGIEVALLFWDNPFVHYDEHAITHVYRSTSNDFSSATRIGSATGISYVDREVQGDTTYYYWIVWESTDGLTGQRSSSVNDRPASNLVFPPVDEDEEGDTDEDTNPNPLEGPAVLESVGSAQQTGTTTYSEVNVGGRFPGTFSGTRPYYSFSNWGLWAKVGDRTLFRVDIRSGTFALTRHVEGSQSGSNPVSGSAVWTGGVRAYDAHPDTYGTPVTGTARLEVDFSATTVDVDFTGFSGGHPDLSWDGLRIGNGRFGDQRAGYREITGAFYGAEHQGVAGKFQSPRLDGVFGATR